MHRTGLWHVKAAQQPFFLPLFFTYSLYRRCLCLTVGPSVGVFVCVGGVVAKAVREEKGGIHCVREMMDRVDSM